jgi:putative endonuclease
MAWFVYILLSSRYRKTYTGHTDSVEERLREHNAGKSEFTSRFCPWDVIHTEECATRPEAIKREQYYKSGAGRRAIRKLLELKGLGGGSLASL